MNSPYSGSNAVYFEKVAANWGETTVTWNSQPATTTTGRIWQAASTSSTENIQVNIASFVQEWVNSPSTNYGMKMSLENEVKFRGRAYASEEHATTSIRPKLVITYATSSGDPVTDKINNIFAPLNKSQVPTGFLSDYGREFLPLDAFNGALTDSNRVNMDAWRLTYASLYSSRIYGTNLLPTLATVNNTIKTTQSSTTAIPVAMAHAYYAYIKPDAFTNNLLKVENEQLKDVAGSTQSPYAQRSFFTASPVKNNVNSGSVSLIFKPELFYNTTGKTVQTLYVDFADGRGYVSAAWNAPVAASYSSDGLKLIKIKARFTDNSLYECYTQLEVKNAGVSVMRYPARIPHTSHVFAASATHSGGEIFISYGSNNDVTISKPLIVVEGFDASTVAPDIVNPYTYESFIGGINATANFDFNDQLDLAGYDLIFLNFNNGVDDITRNAALFEEVVNWVNAQKVSGAEANVVMGLSMGGLVARYGLAKMTKQGTATQTRLLVTHDSPHKGANVPLGFQHLLTSVPDFKVLSNVGLGDLSPALKAGFDLLDAPASRQMLILRSENGNAVSNTFLDGAYRSMITFGSSGPQPSYRFVATSQGAECGQQLFAPYAELGRLNSESFLSPLPWLSRKALKADVIINALPEQGTSKRITYFDLRYEFRRYWFIKWEKSIGYVSKNAPSSAQPWDGAPGGTYSLTDDGSGLSFEQGVSWAIFFRLSASGSLAGQFSFVPTVSALDISSTVPATLSARYVGGVSPTYPSRAENFIAQERVAGTSTFNIRHIRFTDRNAQWIFNVMQNSVSNNGQVCASECTPAVTMTLSGSTACSNTSTSISVPALGTGFTYNWSVSPGLSIVSGNGTNQIGVKATGSSGSGSVNLTITNQSGCSYQVPSRTISLGVTPASPVISGPKTVCDGGNWTASMPANANSINWDFDQAAFEFVNGGPGSSNLAVRFRPGYNAGWISAQACSPCGCSYATIFGISRDSNLCYGSFTYSYYPNPTSDELTVSYDFVSEDSVANITSSSSPKPIKTFEARLLNDKGKVLLSGKNEQAKDKVILNTKNIPNGTYYLHILDGKEAIKQQIVIQH